MEKESSEWQVQGQPTVLLTLAHIFHHFAPLLVSILHGWGVVEVDPSLAGIPCDQLL